MTTPTTNSPNLAAKNLLAKLMAAEDLVVEHDPKAQTASFNMDTRVLTLPVWKDLDADTLDMLIGHEVSHALHTPAGRDPLMDACKTVDPKNPMVAKDYLNVVEDARIERMIKERFPGLRKSFAAGYRELVKRDLFGLKKVGDLKTLPLIDRVNLQYKIGWLIDVPFTAAELPLAQRVAKTVTWEDVVALSKAIYDFAKEQNKGNAPEPQKGDGGGKPQDTSDDDEGEAGEADGSLPNDEEGDEEGDESSTMPTDGEGDEKSDEKSDDGDSDSSDEDGTDEDGKSKGGEKSDENEDAEDSTEGGEKSNETDSDADAADAKSKNGDEETEGETEDAEATDDVPAPSSVTMKNAEDALKGLIDQNATATYYADLPEVDKGFVVTLKDAQASLRTWGAAKKTAAEAVYAAWKAQNAGAVQVLATEFDRRKAADAHKRTMTAETGSIDPNRLHAYRIAEDIFLSNTYVKDGKNHGLVLLLDMSGSMAPVFYDTMAQLVTLAHFCRRVNIPFTFYGYTDRAVDVGANKGVASFKKSSFNAEEIRTRLVTLLQDGMKQNDFTETCGLLLLSAYDSSSGLPNTHPAWTALKNANYNKAWGGVNWMCLDNTPTNAALLGLPSIMEEFKRVKRVQVMNLIVLTDGEASDDLTYYPVASEDYKKKMGLDSYGYAKRGNVVWRDKAKRKTYDTSRKSGGGYYYGLNREQQSGLLLSIIQDRVGGKTVCIHLMAPKSGKEFVRSLHAEYNNKTVYKSDADRAVAAEKSVTAWKDNDWVAVANGRGFSEYIVIRAETKCDNPTLDDVNLKSDSALRDLRKAFTKSMAATKANRPLLTRVADLVSK